MKYLEFKKLIFVILICNTNLFSQISTQNVIIAGHINIKDTTYTDFKILLLDNNYQNIKTTYADSNRNFIIIIPKSLIKDSILKLILNHIPKEIQGGNKNSYCGSIWNSGIDYVTSQKIIRTKNLDTINLIECDFEPSRICHEKRFPCISFGENNLEMKNCSGERPDSALKCFVEILQANPSFVIEISGHADIYENEPVQISQNRAEMIKNMLTILNINPKRLIIRSYSNSRPIITKRQIDIVAGEQEKNEMKGRNRRVVFSVVRNDFSE